jgi:Fe-S cluster biogenesis protein NfuA
MRQALLAIAALQLAEVAAFAGAPPGGVTLRHASALPAAPRALQSGRVRATTTRLQTRLRMDAGGEAAAAGEVVSPFAGGQTPGEAGKDLEFNAQNVDAVLDSVRPYLIADGGNCRVVEVDQTTGDVSLELEGACSSCPSSTVTLKMGIERALRETFGDRLGEVRQVTPGAPDTLTQQLVDELLAPVMPAVKGLGGDMAVVGLDPVNGAVTIRYSGPEKLTYGIELTLKDHPLINTVTFASE